MIIEYLIRATTGPFKGMYYVDGMGDKARFVASRKDAYRFLDDRFADLVQSLAGLNESTEIVSTGEYTRKEEEIPGPAGG